MENLTLAQKIIKPHTIDPLEYHTVVVLERIGEAGEEFRFEIEPGQRAPRMGLALFQWLRGRKEQEKYFAYAVTGDKALRLNLTTPVSMEDHVHKLLLLITIDYAVAEPRVVVTSRNHDPVRKLREEAARVLQRDVAWRSWISIRTEFRELAQEIAAANRERLDRFAAQYGLKVHSVEVACKLDDADVLDMKTEASVAVQTEVHRVTAELERVKATEEAKTNALRSEQAHNATVRHSTREQELMMLMSRHSHEEAVRNQTRQHELLALDDMQRFDRERLHAAVEGRMRVERIFDAATEAAVKALENAGAAIRTPAELLEAAQSLYATVAQSRLMLEDGGVAPVTLPGQFPVPGQRQVPPGAQSGSAMVILEALGRIEQAPCDLPVKRQLQSAILHLVAEVMLDGSADAATTARYGERVAELRLSARLPVETFDHLKRFVDLEQLKAALC